MTSHYLAACPESKGCWDITDDCFWKCGCGAIDFRECCEKKQIRHCGECADFPCGPYLDWVNMEGATLHRAAMERLASMGKRGQR
jgi:hypothetical protein